ncbi:GtrA family protein [Chitinimonas sp.]|uniref:GtrA family protein n=1 Tax=Chitinimonas sp. TaxID=1934313 RepID=UPI0035B0205A
MIDRLYRQHQALVDQFLRFAMVGLCGTGMQYFCLWLGTALLGASAVHASAVGYVFGSLVNYWLNYLFTFKSEKSHLDAASRYYTVVGIGWCINTGLMKLFVDVLLWPKWPAQLLTTGIGLLWNFGGSRWWAFRHRTASPRGD